MLDFSLIQTPGLLILWSDHHKASEYRHCSGRCGVNLGTSPKIRPSEPLIPDASAWPLSLSAPPVPWACAPQTGQAPQIPDSFRNRGHGLFLAPAALPFLMQELRQLLDLIPYPGEPRHSPDALDDLLQMRVSLLPDQQHQGVPQHPLSRFLLRTSAGLHGNDAGLAVGEEFQEPTALQLFAVDFTSLHIYPVQLHDRLCQIQSIGCNLHDESSLSFAWVNFHFGTLMPSGSSEDSLLKLPAAGPV